MEIANNILELIGHTPLVRLHALTQGLTPTILAKLESMNPGGSVKDRIGVRMIEWAEAKGELKPGGTIIEPTSGNTGAALAMAAAIKGYTCIFVLPDKINESKRALLRAYGAEIVVTPTNVTPDSPQHYVNVAKRLAQEIPGAYYPNQYNHPANKPSHIATTGPEIWEDTKGKVDVLVGGLGTCGTLSGTATFLKEQNPDLYVIATDPEGSIFSGDMPRPYLVEGIGEDFLPRNLERGVIDEFIRVSDRDSFHTARRLAREEGILAGGSSGTALAGALQYAMRCTEALTIVVILPDDGRNYLTTFFNDAWMQEKGLLEFKRRTVTIREVMCDNDAKEVPPLVSVGPEDKVSHAIELMHRYKISQLPVIAGKKNVGSIQEDTLMKMLHDGTDAAYQEVDNVMGAPLPEVAVLTDAQEAYRLLMAGANAILVVEEKRPRAVLTRIDLINYWVTNRE
jgi:cystathionine beta-synthase